MLILMAAALLPAFFLLIYVYRKDRVEPEPPRLIIKLLLLGGAAGVLAGIIEGAALRLLNAALRPGVLYYFLEAFLIVALAEEGCKLLMLKWGSWRHPAFNYRFDGLVYAAAVSLGFAALENVLYVLGYGLQVAVSRALLAIPAHLCFGIFMGLFYAQAKRRQTQGRPYGGQLLLAFIVPLLLHGFYDFCLFSNTYLLLIPFFIFVVILDIVTIRTIRREARQDQPLHNEPPLYY